MLCANDRIISVSSLISGVAAATPEVGAILSAGVAAFIASARSVAAGEYISVSSHSDSEQADILREQAALALMIKGREVWCTRVDAEPRRAGFQRTDRYGRPVARCEAGERDLGTELIRRRHAVRWPRNPA